VKSSFLSYSAHYLRRRSARTALVSACLSLSMASVFTVYGIAGYLTVQSDRALAYLTQDGSLWLVPPEGITVDRRLGALVVNGYLPDMLVARVVALDKTASVVRITSKRVSIDGVDAVFYADERDSGDSVHFSPTLWAALGPRSRDVPHSLTIQGLSVGMISINGDLPTWSAGGPFTTWNRISERQDVASMMLVRSSSPTSLANAIAQLTHMTIVDNPSELVVRSDHNGSIVLLQGSRSRFDPFSLSTKFAALTLNGDLATVSGWTARGLFLIGILFSISAALIEVEERREEIAVFILYGMRSDFTLLLFVESAVLVCLASVMGFLASLAVLSMTLPAGSLLTVVGPDLGMGCLYAVVLLFVAPLVAAQKVSAIPSASSQKRTLI
jgi:hypothetical protein